MNKIINLTEQYQTAFKKIEPLQNNIKKANSNICHYPISIINFVN